MELKFQTKLDKSCVYYVWNYYIAVYYHSYNIDNLLYHTFFYDTHYQIFKRPSVNGEDKQVQAPLRLSHWKPKVPPI